MLVGSPAWKELLSEGVDPCSVPPWDLGVEEMKDRPCAVVLWVWGDTNLVQLAYSMHEWVLQEEMDVINHFQTLYLWAKPSPAEGTVHRVLTDKILLFCYKIQYSSGKFWLMIFLRHVCVHMWGRLGNSEHNFAFLFSNPFVFSLQWIPDEIVGR